jgi:NADH:ubiquinone oxidoreductase subunit F (NADH-binding)
MSAPTPATRRGQAPSRAQPQPQPRPQPPVQPPAPARPVGLPRLLAGIPADGALDLAGHLDLHGALPVFVTRGRHGAAELIEQVERAGLRGRGGGGFPTAAKLRAVTASGRKQLGGRPVVLVNAAEGEPASLKDRTLLQALPHLVLDGGELAARAVGAEEIVLGVCESATAALRAVTSALAERTRQGHGDASRIRLHTVPNRYVAGQESALVNHVNGGPALPTFTPPRPFERGVQRRPTLIANVETLAQLALIARHGAEWFRELGTAAQPGSALVTLAGAQLAHPGVYEIEIGAPLSALIDAAGGVTGELRAALLGGYGGVWLDGGGLRGVGLSDEQLAPHGASLGSGVIVLLSGAACPVAELARLTRWLARQSARQCGPCRFGLDAIADTVELLRRGATGADAQRRGDAGADAQRRLAALGSLVRGRGACGHPDGVARLVASALDVFATELADHARRGPCAACERPSELPRPSGTRAAASGDRPAIRKPAAVR